MSSAVREATVKSLEGTTITRRHGRPTFAGVNGTRDELTAIFAKAKTSHPEFPLGERFGFAPAVMKGAKFVKLHNPVAAANDELDDDWEFTYPQRPPAYDETIGANLGDNARRKKEAQHTDTI